MAFVIIDLEFNNLCGIHKCLPNVYKEYPNLNDLELVNEIIEIGAVKLDIHMKPLEQLRVFIKPTVIPVINPNILDITKIKVENLQNGITFSEGIDKLKAMIDENDIICSWAKDDIAEIIRNAKHHKYDDLSWIKNYLDIQEYTTKILGHKKSLGLKKALKYLNIKVDENLLHDALNDAIYTGDVFKTIYNSKAIKKYIVKDIFNMPALEIGSLSDIELNYDKINQICPKCSKKLEMNYEFIPVGWRFIALGTCNKCKCRVLNELIIKKSLSGDIIYNELQTIIDEFDYLRYENKIKLKLKKECTKN